MKNLGVCFLMLFVVLIFCTKCKYVEGIPRAQVTNVGIPTIDSTVFEAHLDSLSSDYFLGRMPFSLGEERTIEYLENSLKSYGLSPMPSGSYTQKVPLVEIDGTPSPSLDIHIEDMVLTLNLSEDFIIHSERPSKNIKLENSELVFCGYGIVAPEYGWNDYKGVDMTGKTAVVLVNDPGLGGEDSTFFKGDIMTYYGRWTYKYEEADRQGAAGLLLIHETRMASYPWQVVSSSWSGPQLHLDEGETKDDCGIKGWIHLEMAKEMASLAGYDLSTMIKNARKPGFKPFPMNAHAYVSLDNTIKKNTSSNVIAYKKGTKKPNEYVVFSAHWDHLGIGRPVSNDSIYNGALDNASGCALQLAIAKEVAKTDWDRSVVFAFMTAEEQGLLGSSWYVENPPFPLESTVANINIDGVNIIGSAKDLTITGYGQSNLDQFAADLVKKQARYVQGELTPEKGSFFRSDHFNFAKKGIPAFYGKGGNHHRIEGIEYAKDVSKAYTQTNYHQPSDEYQSGEWDLRGAVEDGNFMIQLASELAKESIWPEWEAKSEFKASDQRHFAPK